MEQLIRFYEHLGFTMTHKGNTYYTMYKEINVGEFLSKTETYFKEFENEEDAVELYNKLLNSESKNYIRSDIKLINTNKDVVEETIRLITENEILIEMANLSPKRTHLQATIWSDNNGVSRNKKDKQPRVKIGIDDAQVSVSIEKEPKILAQTKNIKQSDMKKIKDAMEYVGRNYDLFLKHYNSSNDVFDDYDLFKALAERGDYIL